MREKLSELMTEIRIFFRMGAISLSFPRVKHTLSSVLYALVLALCTAAGAYLFAITFCAPRALSASVSDKLNTDYTRTLTAEGESRQLDDRLLFSLDGKDWGEDSAFNVHAGDYAPAVMDVFGNTASFETQTAEINEIISLTLCEKRYLAVGAGCAVEYELISIGDVDRNLVWSSSAPDIVSVDGDGNVTALAAGDALITATASSGLSASVEVLSTQLITPYRFCNYKYYLPAYRYSWDDAATLDEILFSRIDDAGYGTRAGAVAAARFLALEFPYRISYFFENGRLNNHSGIDYVDGEGRYYHRGLYLSTDKYADLKAIFSGPAIWGAPLTNWDDNYGYIRGKLYPNGLDCSGFVSWSLYNGGFDVGDSGSGDTWRDDDMCDLGEPTPLTSELARSGIIKAGDLTGHGGHVAMIIGVTDDTLYIAESLVGGLRVVVFPMWLIDYSPDFTYVCFMDSVYGEDGNYTEMW